MRCLINIPSFFKNVFREAVEVVYPFIMDYDAKCVWAGHLLHNMEASMAFRNHIMVFNSLVIGNQGTSTKPAFWIIKILSTCFF